LTPEILIVGLPPTPAALKLMCASTRINVC
jgi:hypothetical protein